MLSRSDLNCVSCARSAFSCSSLSRWRSSRAFASRRSTVRSCTCDSRCSYMPRSSPAMSLKPAMRLLTSFAAKRWLTDAPKRPCFSSPNAACMPPNGRSTNTVVTTKMTRPLNTVISRKYAMSRMTLPRMAACC